MAQRLILCSMGHQCKLPDIIKVNNGREMIKLNSRFNLSREEKEPMIAEIKGFFLEQRDEEIGDLGALLLLDFFADKLAPFFYNRGIIAAKAMLAQKLEDLHELEIWNQGK